MGGEAATRPPEIDTRLAELARRQHGVVSARQVQALGLSPRAVRDRAASGRLHRIHRGVYAVGHQVLGADGFRMAAVLAVPGSVLARRSALDLLGVRRSERVRHEVLTTRTSAITTVHVHRTRSLPPEHVTAIRGIPVTIFARALCDATPDLTDQQLTRAIHEAEILRIFDANQITDPPKRLASLITQFRPQPANEGLETLFARLMPPDLPRHEFNANVAGYEVDVLFPQQRVIVELDDRRTHQTRHAFERDRAKDAALTALGYRVLRITWQRLTGEPHRVIAELRATLGSPAP